jgi:hypothetical protein
MMLLVDVAAAFSSEGAVGGVAGADVDAEAAAVYTESPEPLVARTR